MKLNLQPNESVVSSNGNELDVVNIWRTIQGEGSYAGVPSVFVRLAGCNLKCRLCDTDYTSHRQLAPIEKIHATIDSLTELEAAPLVVITGGEPFRQNLGPLVNLLLFEGFMVQIETNGTLYQPLPYHLPDLSVVCSPKTAKIHPQLTGKLSGLKYILQAGYVDDSDGLPLNVLGEDCRPYRSPNFKVPIYLQPLDEEDVVKNKANLDAVIASCLKYGYIVSLQLHKIIGLE